MPPSQAFSEFKIVWGSLPPLARYTIGGAVIGAVGYLLQQVGPYGALPREMRYRSPSPQDTSWHAGHGYRDRQHAKGSYQSPERAHDEWRR